MNNNDRDTNTNTHTLNRYEVERLVIEALASKGIAWAQGTWPQVDGYYPGDIEAIDWNGENMVISLTSTYTEVVTGQDLFV